MLNHKYQIENTPSDKDKSIILTNLQTKYRDVKPFYKLDIRNFTLPSYESP